MIRQLIASRAREAAVEPLHSFAGTMSRAFGSGGSRVAAGLGDRSFWIAASEMTGGASPWGHTPSWTVTSVVRRFRGLVLGRLIIV